MADDPSHLRSDAPQVPSEIGAPECTIEVTPERIESAVHYLMRSGFLENSESDTGVSLIVRDVLRICLPGRVVFLN
jgi:hypothetical protein